MFVFSTSTFSRVASVRSTRALSPIFTKSSAKPLNFKRNMSVETHSSLGLVSTTHAPAAVGPYTQAIKVGDLLFASGSIGLDPAVGKLVEGGVEAQAEQSLKNLKAVIEAGGSELGKIVKTTVFLANMDDFVAVNAIYTKFFGNHKPARSAVQVARLPLNALFEIEAIASLA
ncbi:YjgF-like protein [Trametopsis cervina]|nr:YjgF-like protein [Trametopsis cervina]